MAEDVNENKVYAGYVPGTLRVSVRNDRLMEEKETILPHHCEKLAVTFWPLSTLDTDPRVVKNENIIIQLN